MAVVLIEQVLVEGAIGAQPAAGVAFQLEFGLTGTARLTAE